MTFFQRKTRILMVCTENICRSPMAEGLLRHYLLESGSGHGIEVRSAGTRVTWPGCRPDQRAQKVAALRGIDISRKRARRVTPRDLERSDFIFVMDESNMTALRAFCPPQHQHRISFLLSHHAGQTLQEVPDPYFGNIEGFERVFRIMEAAMGDLVSYIGTAKA